MKDSEILNYLSVRNYQLSEDEILFLANPYKHKIIDHIEYVDEMWKLWTINGYYFEFTKR